jgi:signal transduction histidine kinase
MEQFTGRILIVDDEPANVRLLERIVRDAGWAAARSTTDSREAAALHAEWRSDLVLLDLMMPYLDGVAVMKQLRATSADGEFLPIVILTADATGDAKRRALDAGATDFLTKPFDRIEIVLRIKNLLETRRLYLEREQQKRSLEATVRERTERLLQSEKVATMGSLLAGVAHELNNPLAVVMGQAMLLRESAANSPFAARADRIHAASERCARIVKNFLALARSRPPERGPVAFDGVVTQAVELLAYELRTSSVEVEVHLSESVPVFQADGHQLHQVIVNLLANAHHAMRQTSGLRRITLATGFDAATARVRLTITDTGPGIPPELQAKIFEPFFTTKPPGEGTGLGLSLCRGIVEEHGGTLTVESQPGHGATFIMTLPAITAAAVGAVGATGGVTRRSPKSILVVEDEPEIAATLVETLEHDGHKVDVASDGIAALTRVQSADYDLIITDTKMPRMDGLEFHRELIRQRPVFTRRVVFVTGDLMDKQKRDWLESTGCLTLAKPFDVNDVRRAVHRVIGTVA